MILLFISTLSELDRIVDESLTFMDAIWSELDIYFDH